MAIVNGFLKDIFNVSMSGRQAKIVFRLNEESVALSGTNAGTMYPTEEQSAVTAFSTGAFSVDLQPTTLLLTDAWYTLRLEWVDGKGPDRAYPGWQVRVGAEGGRIDKLITMGPPQGGWGGSLPNLSFVIVALEKPKNLQVGQLWLQAAPNYHASANEALNTGKLWRGK